MKLILLIFILIFLSLLINVSLLLFLWIYIKNKCQKCWLSSQTKNPGINNIPQNKDQKLKKFIVQLLKENLSI